MEQHTEQFAVAMQAVSFQAHCHRPRVCQVPDPTDAEALESLRAVRAYIDTLDEEAIATIGVFADVFRHLVAMGRWAECAFVLVGAEFAAVPDKPK